LGRLADILFILELSAEQRKSPLKIYGSSDAVEAVKRYILDDKIGGDFLSEKSLGESVEFKSVITGDEIYISDISLKIVATIENSLSLVATKGKSDFLIIGDLRSRSEISQELNRNLNIKAIFLKCKFPNRFRTQNDKNEISTPDGVIDFVSGLENNIKIFIYRLKNIYAKEIKNELNSLNVFKNGGKVLEDGDKRAPKIPAILIEKNKKEDFAIKALGATLNIEPIQNAGYSSGFFNVIPDSSGMIRSVPLVISFDDVLYPSLALEIVRVVSGEKKIFINYDELGIENISIGQTVIPTDAIGGITVNYRGGFKNFKYLSAKDIYDGEFNADEVEGKIVLIGTSAIGLYDLRTTPFDSAFAGVEVHANAIDNILSGDFIYKPSYADGVTVILVVFSSFLIVFSVTSMNFYGKILTFFAASFLYVWGSYYALFHEGIILNILFPLAAISLAFVTTLAFDYFYSIKSERAIRAKFASKVSKSVMDDILKNTNGNELSIKNKEVTIFFSDIRGFTSISEKLGAKELIALLNRYMQPMSEIIIKNQGTIDKFIGDAVMAYWNAPLDIQNHADLAVKSALEQFEALKILNSQLAKENLPQISIGIGINTGEVIVGEMGCEIRSDYTVIGDAINLGSRLESLCKFYGSNLNISNFTKERLKEKYMFRFLDLVRVKGKNEPVEIWRVLGYGEAQGELKKELEIYDKAIALYKKAKFLEALEIFKELEIKANKQDKKIYEIYIARCEQFIKTPPSDFDGVFDHATKS
jgi:adenylate/guanylate cyclase